MVSLWIRPAGPDPQGVSPGQPQHNLTMTTTTTNTKAQKSPAYVTLVQALVAECRAKGYPVELDPATASGVPENKGYCFLRLGGEGALIIPKGVNAVGLLDSHVDL